MSFKRTIAVLLLAALLAGAAWYTQLDDAEGGAAAPEQRALLEPGDLPMAEVARIRLVRPGEPVVELRRGVAEDDWWQAAPIEHPMDPWSVRQLMVQALELRVSDVLAPEELSEGLAPGALGLDPPLAQVTYEWPGGTLTLDCGRAAIAGRAYTRITSEPAVHITSRGLYERTVEGEPMEWRDQRLFPNVGVDATRVEIDDGETRIVMSRQGRVWSMEQPAVTRVDGPAIEELFAAAAKARSAGYLMDQPDDLSLFGLDRPAALLEITDVQRREREGIVERVPASRRLLVGSRVGGTQDRFAMIEGRETVFRVGAEALVALFRRAAEFVDPTGSGVPPADVAAMMIRPAGAEAWRLERDLERWVMPVATAEPDPLAESVEADAVRAEALLQQLTATRATKVQLASYPQELEVATVTLIGYDERPLDTIRIARDPETGEWAMENGDDVLRVFPASVEMSFEPSAYEKRELARGESSVLADAG